MALCPCASFFWRGLGWHGHVPHVSGSGAFCTRLYDIRKIVNRSQWFSVSVARNASRLLTHATHHSHNPWQLPHSIIHLNLRHARNSCPGRVSRRSARHQPYPPLNEALRNAATLASPKRQLTPILQSQLSRRLDFVPLNHNSWQRFVRVCLKWMH